MGHITSQIGTKTKCIVFISIIYWLKFKSFFHWNQRKITSKIDFRKNHIEENNFFRFLTWWFWSSDFPFTFFKIQKTQLVIFCSSQKYILDIWLYNQNIFFKLQKKYFDYYQKPLQFAHINKKKKKKKTHMNITV